MNNNIALALAIALALIAPGAVSMMPLCSGGDDDFLSDTIVSDDTTCKDMWEMYIGFFSAVNPEMGTNKLTYNKCSASMGEDFDGMDFWYFTDFWLAPTCCTSGTSACDALVEPNMCANSDDFQADLAISFDDDAESSSNPLETCADVNKFTAFAAAGFKYDLFTEYGNYNGPNGDKGKVMSRIFDWNKETCTNRDTGNSMFSKKFGKMLGFGASFGCCGDSGNDACYSSMGMLWQCKLDAERTGVVSDACAEFYASNDDGGFDVLECVSDCSDQCDTADDDACMADCDVDELCAWLDVGCEGDTFSFCSTTTTTTATTRRQLGKEGASKKTSSALAGGPKTWGTIAKGAAAQMTNKKAAKKANHEKFAREAKQLAQRLADAKATAKAAHGRAAQKLAANKAATLGAARAAATAAHAAKKAAAAAAPASVAKEAKPSFRAAVEAKRREAKKAQ